VSGGLGFGPGDGGLRAMGPSCQSIRRARPFQ
jgi:hypothetical protein